MAGVLYISPNGYLGGAERFVLNTAKGHGSTFQVYYLFLNDGPCVDLVRQTGKGVLLLPFKLRMSRPWSLFKAVLYVRDFLRDKNISIVHSTMPYAQILASLATVGSNVKKVWFQHDPIGGIFDHIANYSPVDLILFNSTYTQAQHNSMNYARRLSHMQKITPLGIEHFQLDKSIIDSLRTELKGKAQVLLGSAGRISEWKGFLNILKALQLLSRDIDFRFVLIGSPNSDNDRSYFQTLQNFVSKNNLGDKIKFIPHVDNLHSYLSALDLFIHSFIIPEPFGLVIGEAMICRTLVLGGNRGGVEEILINDETGFTFESTGDDAPSNLYNRLKNIIPDLNSSAAEEIKENAFNLISSHYSIQKMTEELEKHYKQLLS